MDREGKILFVSVFGRTEGRSNDRINNLLYYAPKGKVDIITTNFSHSKKHYKQPNDDRRITFIKVPKYQRNLGIKRIFSHWVFAFKLQRELKNRIGWYSHVYCITPTPTSTIVAGNFANKHGLPFVVDIIDVWPDGLLPISGVFKIIKPLLYPWRLIFNSGIKKANYIIGADSNYTKIGKNINLKAESKTFFLGMSGSSILSEKYLEEKKDQILSIENELVVGYAGSLGNLYDFDYMFDICNTISAVQNRKVKLRFIGGGVLEDELRGKARKFNNIDVEFTGALEYSIFIEELRKCHVGLNVFKENELIYMSYKIYDYLASGLFVLNNLSGDANFFVSRYNVGINIGKRNSENNFTIENFQKIINKSRFNALLKDLSTENIIHDIYKTIVSI